MEGFFITGTPRGAWAGSDVQIITGMLAQAGVALISWKNWVPFMTGMNMSRMMPHGRVKIGS